VGRFRTARRWASREVEFDPKRSDTVIEVSDLQEIYAAIEDAVGFEEFWQTQQEQLDLAIDRDGLAKAVMSGDAQYGATDQLTSLDRVIASSDGGAGAGPQRGCLQRR